MPIPQSSAAPTRLFPTTLEFAPALRGAASAAGSPIRRQLELFPNKESEGRDDTTHVQILLFTNPGNEGESLFDSADLHNNVSSRWPGRYQVTRCPPTLNTGISSSQLHAAAFGAEEFVTPFRPVDGESLPLRVHHHESVSSSMVQYSTVFAVEDDDHSGHMRFARSVALVLTVTVAASAPRKLQWCFESANFFQDRLTDLHRFLFGVCREYFDCTLDATTKAERDKERTRLTADSAQFREELTRTVDIVHEYLSPCGILISDKQEELLRKVAHLERLREPSTTTIAAVGPAASPSAAGLASSGGATPLGIATPIVGGIGHSPSPSPAPPHGGGFASPNKKLQAPSAPKGAMEVTSEQLERRRRQEALECFAPSSVVTCTADAAEKAFESLLREDHDFAVTVLTGLVGFDDHCAVRGCRNASLWAADATARRCGGGAGGPLRPHLLAQHVAAGASASGGLPPYGFSQIPQSPSTGGTTAAAAAAGSVAPPSTVSATFPSSVAGGAQFSMAAVHAIAPLPSGAPRRVVVLSHDAPSADRLVRIASLFFHPHGGTTAYSLPLAAAVTSLKVEHHVVVLRAEGKNGDDDAFQRNLFEPHTTFQGILVIDGVQKRVVRHDLSGGAARRLSFRIFPSRTLATAIRKTVDLAKTGTPLNVPLRRLWSQEVVKCVQQCAAYRAFLLLQKVPPWYDFLSLREIEVLFNVCRVGGKEAATSASSPRLMGGTTTVSVENGAPPTTGSAEFRGAELRSQGSYESGAVNREVLDAQLGSAFGRDVIDPTHLQLLTLMTI